MSDFDFQEPAFLSEDLLMLRAELRRYVNRAVVPNGEAWEAAGKIPREIFREMGALGFLGMRHPEQYGGGGLGPLASIILAEELSRSSFGGFASSVTVHSDMSIAHIAKRGTAKQKERFLPGACRGELVGAVCVTEPEAGSDVGGLRMRAVRDGNGWVLNGQKAFITNGVYGDVFIVAARTDPDAKPSRGISLFIVERDTPGFVVSKKLDKHGWRCSDTADLFFDDVRVPAENLLGDENAGFYGIMNTFQDERLIVGALSAGTCAKAIELTTDYVKTRKAFGKTLWDQQATRIRLATLASKAAAARALTYAIAQIHAEGRECTREVSMVKAFSAEVLQEVVHGCLQLHGGTGFMTGTPIERMARDARVLTIGGGATEVMLEEVAKRM